MTIFTSETKKSFVKWINESESNVSVVTHPSTTRHLHRVLVGEVPHTSHHTTFRGDI